MLSNEVTFAELLKTLRTRQALSQKQLADKAKVSDSLICLYEKGGNPPRYPKSSTATGLASALGLEGQERADFLAATRPLAPPNSVALLEQLGLELRKPDLPDELKRRMAADLAAVLDDYRRMRNPTVSWAVIPVAGWHAQMLVAEMTARVIEYAAKEATAAGIKRLMIVVTPTQREELPTRLKQLPTVEEVKYVVQEKQMGFGHALLEAQRASIKDKTLAVITPDETVDPECLRKMVSLYTERQSPVVAVRRMKSAKVRLYGVVRGKRSGRVIAVTRLEEKPEHPPTTPWVMLGRYILPPPVFTALARTPVNTHSGHIELTDALQVMIGKGLPIDAWIYDGPFRTLGLSLDEFIKAINELKIGSNTQ